MRRRSPGPERGRPTHRCRRNRHRPDAGGSHCQGVTGEVAARALERAGLAVNKNQIPFDIRPPEAPSGLRLSSNAGTARGFGPVEFQAIAGWIERVIRNHADEPAIASVRDEVTDLCRKFPIY